MHVAVLVGRRLLQVAATVVLVALLTFALMRLLPGDPVLVLLGDRATDANIARLRQQMGLDESLLTQFLLYVWNLLNLRLGDSITMRVPVTALIVERLPVTLALTGLATLLALVMAVPLALAASLRENGIADTIIRVVSQLGLSTPVFYLGLILLITLAAGLGWFPVGGIGDSLIDDLHHLFLPALTLALSLAAVLMRNLRVALTEVLHAEFVSFAAAKGISRRLLLGRHVLRNALVSTINLLGIHIGSLVGGAVITETVFAIPGVGRLMIDSIFARDYAVMQGATLVIAVMVSLVFLATDAVQALLDPRVDA
jgi:peptide/nickel transport system permease protein